jgi:hypothetical protein
MSRTKGVIRLQDRTVGQTIPARWFQLIATEINFSDGVIQVTLTEVPFISSHFRDVDTLLMAKNRLPALCAIAIRAE